MTSEIAYYKESTAVAWGSRLFGMILSLGAAACFLDLGVCALLFVLLAIATMFFVMGELAYIERHDPPQKKLK